MINLNIPDIWIEQVLTKYGSEIQPIICIEELSELQKEICKYERGKGNKENLVEEISHSLFSILMIAKIAGISTQEIIEELNEKMERILK